MQDAEIVNVLFSFHTIFTVQYTHSLLLQWSLDYPAIIDYPNFRLSELWR